MAERKVYYKGFDKDMKCRGFQFEEGKTYETDEAKLCEKGFHACECPLDVFRYYAPCDDKGNIQKFHKVTLEDVSPEREEDSKVCAKKITIGAELNFLGLAKAHVEWVKSQSGDERAETGNYSAASNTGICSVSSNTGDYSAASNTGNCSVSSNTGICSVSSNTGFRSVSSNTGNCSVSSNTGNCSVSSNTGNCSVSSNTGNCSVSSNTGICSVALAWGINSKASAALGSYIVLAEYDDDCNLVAAKMGRVDGKRLKPNVFYKLIGGKFVKVDEEETK